MIPARLERAAGRLEICCSIQLSYGTIVVLTVAKLRKKEHEPTMSVRKVRMRDFLTAALLLFPARLAIFVARIRPAGFGPGRTRRQHSFNYLRR